MQHNLIQPNVTWLDCITATGRLWIITPQVLSFSPVSRYFGQMCGAKDDEIRWAWACRNLEFILCIKTRWYSSGASETGARHNWSSKVAVQGVVFVGHPLYIHLKHEIPFSRSVCARKIQRDINFPLPAKSKSPFLILSFKTYD
jgi:hypothetical protein